MKDLFTKHETGNMLPYVYYACNQACTVGYISQRLALDGRKFVSQDQILEELSFHSRLLAMLLIIIAANMCASDYGV